MKLEGPTLFTDGGCIASNPSEIGGTWAWILVDESGTVLDKTGGVVLAAELGRPVTNNFTELLAAVEALEGVGADWDGVLWTDSLSAWRRLDVGGSFRGIGTDLRERLERLWVGRKWRAKLLAGHPTRRELMTGYRKRNGLPVSSWNKRADEMCSRLAAKFLQTR